MNTFKTIFSLLLAMAFSAQGQKVKYAFVYQNGYWKVIDTAGKVITDTVFSGGIPMQICLSEGMLTYKSGSKYGFKNLRGKVVVPAIYDEVGCFNNGVARVAVKVHMTKPNPYLPQNHWGLINHKGKLIADTVYDHIGEMDEEGVAILVKDDKIGLIDNKGKLISPFIYQTNLLLFPSPAFADGLLPVLVFRKNTRSFFDEPYKELAYTGKVGFIDHKGQLIIDTVWDLRCSMGNVDADIQESMPNWCGTAMGEYARNARNRPVRPHPFYIIPGYYSFSNGRCVVTKGIKSIVIDTKGDSLFALRRGGMAWIRSIEDKNSFLLVDRRETSFPHRVGKGYKELLNREGVAVEVPQGYEPVDYWRGNVVVVRSYDPDKYWEQYRFRLVNKYCEWTTDTTYNYIQGGTNEYALTNLGTIDSLGKLTATPQYPVDNTPKRPVGGYDFVTPFVIIDLGKKH